MPDRPWRQQPALPPDSPEKEGASWWEQGLGRMRESAGPWGAVTFPWQKEHWEAQPDWTRHAGKAGLGASMTALGALGGYAAPGAMMAASRFVPWLAKPALQFAAPAGQLGALGKLGGVGGLLGSSFMAPGGVGRPSSPEERAAELETIRGGLPAAQPEPPTTPTTPTLPQPGDVGEGAGPGAQPQVIESGGQTFWWNPTGGIYGTGGWDVIPQRAVPGLTAEQRMSESALEREALATESEATRAASMARLQAQMEFETGAITQEAKLGREAQGAAAAQQMAQMYAADPYKYWAQMGVPTPEAVARLTGGEVAPGEPFEQGIPLSTPSQQWWGNLLPSEQQQIMGGLNWMGVDPQDWMATQQRMIPGLGSRQMGPQWAR